MVYGIAWHTLFKCRRHATISDKNKEDTSRCVADYPFPLFNAAKRTAFFQEPDSFYAINIVTGEGGSNMLWCHDLFDRDCSPNDIKLVSMEGVSLQICYIKENISIYM